jgi:hypothetical protein
MARSTIPPRKCTPPTVQYMPYDEVRRQAGRALIGAKGLPASSPIGAYHRSRRWRRHRANLHHGTRWSPLHPGALRTAHTACSVGAVLSPKRQWLQAQASYRAPLGRAAWASVSLKGLHGLSTDRAHCSVGPCPRPSSAPPLQPSPSARPLFRLCGLYSAYASPMRCVRGEGDRPGHRDASTPCQFKALHRWTSRNHADH